MANDHYILDYPEPTPSELYEEELDAYQTAVAAFLRSALCDYLAMTLRRPPTVLEAREMADRAQVLLQEARQRGWEAPPGR